MVSCKQTPNKVGQLLSMRSFIVLIVGALAVGSIAMPKRCKETEDCYEKQMHPDLPVEKNLKRSVNGEEASDFWLGTGRNFIEDKISRQPNTKRAKNVILFLGDGMSLTTIAASRVYIGGEEQQLAFEKFPYTGFSKTYSVDRMVPDSATTSTSYLCGVKANYGTIGVNANIERDNCETTKDESNYVYSIAKWAMDAGKSAGFVTTARVTHASPAGIYAHVAERKWENDNEVNIVCGENSGVVDIATQLVHGDVGSRLKVMLGGGKREFQDGSLNPKGTRTDGKDLIVEYKNKSPRNAFVDTRDDLFDLDPSSADRLLGLFQNSHMKYNLEAIDKDIDQPSLEEMTKRAIEFMEDDENGYFLFVEGGRIDMAHHDNNAKLALDETEQFSNAIEMARQMTNEEDTLILVTSDHSHAFSFSGYPERGRKITGKAGTADDGLPYMTMTYANGPAFETYYDVNEGERIDPTSTSKSKVFSVWPAMAPLESETHGGDDVGVFASGPWAHLFTGVFEQNAIPHMLAYALCVGDGLKMCDK